MSHPRLPPFDEETAALKARKAEDAWNGRSPEQVALAYSPDSRGRNRAETFQGRDRIIVARVAPDGLMRHRIAPINDRPISKTQRLFRWRQGRRPPDHAGLSAMQL